MHKKKINMIYTFKIYENKNQLFLIISLFKIWHTTKVYMGSIKITKLLNGVSVTELK